MAEPPSGDDELDRLRRAWAATYAEMAATAKVVEARLANCRVAAVKDGTVVLHFARQIDLDYVLERAKAQAAIRDAWRRHAGEAHELEFALGAKTGAVKDRPVETATVELPAEGERLSAMVHEVFKSGGAPE